MRRVLLVGAIAVAVVAGAVLALTLKAAPSPTAGPSHITRTFIPAIKVACTGRAGLLGADIGYRFDDTGALRTIDPGDGSVTGLPAEKLAALNDCLAGYPVEPPQPLPRGPYNRNLLYDYYSDVLKPCLEARVGQDDLPPFPTRADFVVRLYAWDPYRTVAPGRTIDELLELIAECPDRPVYLSLAPAPERPVSEHGTG